MNHYLEPSSGLYQRLIGSEWCSVAKIVRRMHLSANQTELNAIGTFRIIHGKNLIARLLMRLLKMPIISNISRVNLKIARQGKCEVWSRMIGHNSLVSTQREGSGGFLIERIGWMEFHFRLAVVQGSLCYYQTAFGIGIGRKSILLPSWFSPKVTATESLSLLDHHSAVVVEVSAPILGLLLKYEGDIRLGR